MGLLRVILAFSVVLFHIPEICGYDIVGGFIAVQCFYIVSGFYMSLILNGKYVGGKNANYLFYSNRIFRLIPLYFFYLVITVGLAFLFYEINVPNDRSRIIYIFDKQHDMLKLSTIFYFVVTNIFVVGHDICSFLAINPHDGSLLLLPSSLLVPPQFQAYKLFFIPQAWTLSLELYFYLLAPFIVRKSRITLIILAMSMALRIYLYSLGFRYLPWNCGFFPTELGMFLVGSLSHRLYVFLNERALIKTAVSLVVSGIMFTLTFCYHLLPQGNTVPYFFNDAQIIYYSSIAVGLPFLFHLTRKSTIDRFIGELSYPIYLCHFILIDTFIFLKAPQYGALPATFMILLSTLVLAAAGMLIIQKPVDRFRQKRYEQALSLSHEKKVNAPLTKVKAMPSPASGTSKTEKKYARQKH